MNPRVTVGRIDKEDHCSLLHTKYGSSRPRGFREDFFYVCPIIKLQLTKLHTKYRSIGSCGFREEDSCTIVLQLYGR